MLILVHIPTTTAVYMVKIVYGCEYRLEYYMYMLLLGILVCCTLYSMRNRLVWRISYYSTEEETANKNYFYSQNPEGNGKTSHQDQDQISS